MTTCANYQHAAAVCGTVTTGLRDLTGFEGADFPGVDKALIGGTVSVDFSGGRYTGVDVTLPSRSCRHFPHEDFDMEVDAWSHVADCIHAAILNELAEVEYPNGTVHMVYDSGSMHPVLL